MSKRTYECALKLLELRKRPGRPKTDSLSMQPAQSELNDIPASSLKGTPSVTGMREWLHSLGHSDDDVDNLNVIHIAGTKGKGSTCAFTRSFLDAYSFRNGFPKQIGLYTSPHLRSIRERIQINNKPIGKDLFTSYFFEVWDGLGLGFDHSPESERKEHLPRFLQLLALLAFHIFIKEKIDATIIETHHGGEFDATNFVQRPVVCGITSIGMDHLAQLGPTIERVAWHKAGIFKPGALGFSTSQDQSVEAVLRSRAADQHVPLHFVTEDRNLPLRPSQLATTVQKSNCSLALAIANAFITTKQYGRETGDTGLNSTDIEIGIGNFAWPGRFQSIVEGRTTWYVDGAHNELSVEEAVRWFASDSKNHDHRKPHAKILCLVFTHFSQERDGMDVLRALAHALERNSVNMSHVCFAKLDDQDEDGANYGKSHKLSSDEADKVLASYTKFWREHDPAAKVFISHSVKEALARVKALNGDCEISVLVTGSLHLVGCTLGLLQPID